MNIDSIFNEFINVVRENKKYTIGLLDKGGTVTNCSNEKLLGTKLDFRSRDENNLFYPERRRTLILDGSGSTEMMKIWSSWAISSATR